MARRRQFTISKRQAAGSRDGPNRLPQGDRESPVTHRERQSPEKAGLSRWDITPEHVEYVRCSVFSVTSCS